MSYVTINGVHVIDGIRGVAFHGFAGWFQSIDAKLSHETRDAFRVVMTNEVKKKTFKFSQNITLAYIIILIININVFIVITFSIDPNRTLSNIIIAMRLSSPVSLASSSNTYATDYTFLSSYQSSPVHYPYYYIISPSSSLLFPFPIYINILVIVILAPTRSSIILYHISIKSSASSTITVMVIPISLLIHLSIL